jgi:hypothetical protein
LPGYSHRELEELKAAAGLTEDEFVRLYELLSRHEQQHQGAWL